MELLGFGYDLPLVVFYSLAVRKWKGRWKTTLKEVYETIVADEHISILNLRWINCFIPQKQNIQNTK
jgi:hypothetical protein